MCRVHPEILASQQLPTDCKKDGVWKRRFEEINNFERYLVDNGIVVLKFFLHVSKKEQKRRFLERIDLDEKNWKFSVNDAKERTLLEGLHARLRGGLHPHEHEGGALVHHPCRQQVVHAPGRRGDHRIRRSTT